MICGRKQLWEEFTEVDSGTADQNNKSEDIIHIPSYCAMSIFMSTILFFSIRKFQFVLLVSLDTFHKIGKRSWKQLVLFQANISSMENSTPADLYVCLGKQQKFTCVSYLILHIPLNMWKAAGCECPLHSYSLVFQKYVLVVKILPCKPYFQFDLFQSQDHVIFHLISYFFRDILWACLISQL